MSNWDLMMPGMGLTAIGLAGVTISFAGIAHTFVDGMHALTGLTMFVGLIFLAAGILDGGVSTSNRAKATTLVVISIALGFGMFAFTMNTIQSTNIFAGLLLAIAFPAIVIAYVAAKMPTRLRPIGAIVTLAGITGIVTFVAFGFVSPDTYIIAEETPDETEEAVPTGPTFAIKILSNSSVQGNPDYDPDVAYVQQGFLVKWTNEDAFAHTVTSAEDMGETFDSGMIDPEEEFILDTSKLEIGEYPYFCLVHPWMKGQLFIEEPKEPASVVIPEGAGVRSEGQVYFDPPALEVSLGTTVKWTNEDAVAHTVTSGTAQGGPNGLFDSGMILAGDSFQFTFTEEGTQDYYCVVHPWMAGSVKVG